MYIWPKLISLLKQARYFSYLLGKQCTNSKSVNFYSFTNRIVIGYYKINYCCKSKCIYSVQKNSFSHEKGNPVLPDTIHITEGCQNGFIHYMWENVENHDYLQCRIKNVLNVTTAMGIFLYPHFT